MPRQKPSPTSRSPYGRPSGWQRLQRQVLDRDNYECQVRYDDICVTTARTVDHIIGYPEALDRGWTIDQADDATNLQAICDPCHRRKTATEARAVQTRRRSRRRGPEKHPGELTVPQGGGG